MHKCIHTYNLYSINRSRIDLASYEKVKLVNFGEVQKLLGPFEAVLIRLMLTQLSSSYAQGKEIFHFV